MTTDSTSSDSRPVPAVAEPVRQDNRWKRWLRRVLLVVSCVCLVLAVVTIWLRIQIGNTDRFVDTIDPIATDAAIQEAVVVKITEGFSARLSEFQTRDTLIDRQQYLAAPINELLTDFVEKTVRSLITSEEFEQFWVDAKQAVHPRMSALLTGSSTENMTTAEGVVTLDLQPVVDAVKTRLSERGVNVFDNIPTDTFDLSVVLFESPELAEIQGLVDVLYSLAFVFPVVALLTLGVFLWLSPNRRSGLIRVGLAVATSMALLLVILAAVRWRYLDGLTNDVNREAAEAFFDILGRYFRAAIRFIALLGILVAVVALATGREGSIPWPRIAANRRPADDRLRQPTWVERNRKALMGGVLAATCLLVITPDHISQDWWRTTLLVALGALVLILVGPHFGGSGTPAPAGPDGPAPTPPSPPSTGGVQHDGGLLGRPTVSSATETSITSMQSLSASDSELLDRVAEALRGTG